MYGYFHGLLKALCEVLLRVDKYHSQVPIHSCVNLSQGSPEGTFEHLVPTILWNRYRNHLDATISEVILTPAQDSGTFVEPNADFGRHLFFTF